MSDFTINERVHFASNVTPKIAWMCYGDFIQYFLDNTNSDIRFGYYVDGEPFCSGHFGEVRYSNFINQ